jgi:hypothetical protein
MAHCPWLFFSTPPSALRTAHGPSLVRPSRSHYLLNSELLYRVY